MAAILLMMVAASGAVSAAPLDVVRNLDPGRYTGDWYEIARLPNRFQNKCAGEVVARYTARPGGGFDVTNRCRQADGSVTEAIGVARTVKGAPTSVLQVRFAPAFLSFLPQVWGDYQVIALDDAHTYALIGTPDRKYLWVLSRTPGMDASTYDALMTTAARQSFDTTKIVKTRQSASR